jgi:bacterioferritin
MPEARSRHRLGGERRHRRLRRIAPRRRARLIEPHQSVRPVAPALGRCQNRPRRSGAAARGARVPAGKGRRMKGNRKVIELLNDVLTAELTAINQYFVHAKMCANWGYLRLADTVRKESLSEMKHAEDLIERILYLDGIPNLQRLGKVNVGETVKEQLKLDRQLEVDAIIRFNKGIALCSEVGDNGSRELLEDILTSEEKHLDWIETQLTLIGQIGEAHYLAQQVREPEE